MMSASTPTPINGKNIVIIGDGPAALSTAIKLKQQGVENVTVFGSRLNEFTRSGNIVPNVFQIINKQIQPLSIQPSPGNHIKDIERQLFSHAKSLGIKFEKKIFVGFADGNNIKVTDKDTDQTESVQVDVVFDCTGTKRSVITELNKILPKEKPAFTTGQKVRFQQKNFAFIRIVAPKNAITARSKIHPQEHRHLDPLARVLAIAKLRELGWNSFHVPLIYTHPFDKKNDPIKGKFNIYVEIPPTLNNDQIIQFTKILLSLAQDKTENLTDYHFDLQHKSKKHPNKQSVTSFSIHPQVTIPGYYLNPNHPLVIHVGDATANLPFETGKGLIFGIERLASIIQSLLIEDGEIKEINENEFKDSFAKHLKKHAAELQIHQSNIKIENALELLNIYRDALAKCKRPDQEEIIKREYLELSKNLFFKLTSNLKRDFGDKSNPMFLVKNKDATFLEKHAANAVTSLNEAFKYKDAFPDDFIEEFKKTAQEILINCEKIAEICLINNKTNSAEKFLESALQIQSRFIDNNERKKLDLYLKLIKIAVKKQENQKILSMVEKVDEEILPNISPKEKTTKLDKMYFHAATAAAKESEQSLKDNKENFDVLLQQANKLSFNISLNGFEYFKAIRRSIIRLEEIKEERRAPLKAL